MTNYKFPIITDIEQVRSAIANKEEFYEADKGDHIIFNYTVNFDKTFPEVETEEDAILRECRGIIFDKATGKIIRRPWHKFFNINEKVETRAINLDWSKPYRVFEKLDGSMIAPYKIGDKVLIGTKMGETEVAKNAENFILGNSSYQDFINYCLERNITPIFEWCSRKNRIVVDLSLIHI